LGWFQFEFVNKAIPNQVGIFDGVPFGVFLSPARTTPRTGGHSVMVMPKLMEQDVRQLESSNR
jgi:hypothetical protein